jgi:hypothetical protein
MISLPTSPPLAFTRILLQSRVKKNCLRWGVMNLNWIGRPVEPVPDQNVHMSQNYMKVAVSLV